MRSGNVRSYAWKERAEKKRFQIGDRNSTLGRSDIGNLAFGVWNHWPRKTSEKGRTNSFPRGELRRLGILICVFCFCAAAQADPLDLLFPYTWHGTIDQIDFDEPSGIVYHEERGTLFVVGDNGDLWEIKPDGTQIRQQHLRDADLEGITYDPATGLLYLAVEGEERILEVQPDDFSILREFTIPRQVKGKTMLKEGGQGIEAIAFVPDSDRPHGGTFYVTNQSFDLSDQEDVSAIFHIELPLRSTSVSDTVAKHIRQIVPMIPDMSGLTYSAPTQSLLVISDAANCFVEISLSGEIRDAKAFPGQHQGGIAFDNKGSIYVAQDVGGILKMRWRFE
jgi:uncharacterized protein YjiK